MKKLTFILVLSVAIIACNKPANQDANKDAKSNTVLWASTVETLLPLVQDTMCDKEYWNEIYKYDKNTMFESIKKAVLAGKLKAYGLYPIAELSIDEFKNRVEQGDSTNTFEDPNNPGTIISALLMRKIKGEDLVEMRFEERIELDTINYTLVKKVSVVSFNIYKIAGNEIIGIKKLFDVKLNDGTPVPKVK